MKNKTDILKKSAAVILSAATLLSLFTFGTTSRFKKLAQVSDGVTEITAQAAETEEQIDKTSMRWISTYGNLRLDVPSEHLNPEEIYKNIEYKKEMFYGTYVHPDVPVTAKDDSDTRKENFLKEHETVDLDGYSTITYMPIKFQAGSDSYNADCTVTFVSKYGGKYLKGSYDINGNQLVFKPKDSKDYKITEFTYDFSFSGGKITLSHNGESVELEAEGLCDDSEWAWTVMRKKAQKSAKIDNIKTIALNKSTIGKHPYFYVYLDGRDSAVTNVASYFHKNGLLNFSWTDADGTIHAYEFVYIFCGKDGLYLFDGTNVFEYTVKDN